jgi:hypothetical protein
MFTNLFIVFRIPQKYLRDSQCHGPESEARSPAPGTLLVDAAPIKAGRDSPDSPAAFNSLII